MSDTPEPFFHRDGDVYTPLSTPLPSSSERFGAQGGAAGLGGDEPSGAVRLQL